MKNDIYETLCYITFAIAMMGVFYAAAIVIFSSIDMRYRSYTDRTRTMSETFKLYKNALKDPKFDWDAEENRKLHTYAVFRNMEAVSLIKNGLFFILCATIAFIIILHLNNI